MYDFFWSLLKPQSYFDLAVYNITFFFFPSSIIKLRLFKNVSICDTARRTRMLDHPGRVLSLSYSEFYKWGETHPKSLSFEYRTFTSSSLESDSVFSHAAWPLEQSWMMFVCKVCFQSLQHNCKNPSLLLDCMSSVRTKGQFCKHRDVLHCRQAATSITSHWSVIQ